MIVVKAPLRISLFGGGTDFPSYFKDKKGIAISTSIDKYYYVGIGGSILDIDGLVPDPCFEFNKFQDSDDVQHRMAKCAFQLCKVPQCRVSLDYVLPAKSGLGTSSAFAVGLLCGLNYIKGNCISLQNLAKQAISLERDRLEEQGGWQDQIAIAYGGLNRIDFADEDFFVKKIEILDCRKLELNKSLMLFYIGGTRDSAQIQVKTEQEIQKKEELMQTIYEIAEQAYEILVGSGKMEQIGYLLDEAWNSKRKLNKDISSPKIDEIYREAKRAGALGGKVLGAGGGGFLLLYVPLEKQLAVKHQLNSLEYVDFQFETEGPRIIYEDSRDLMTNNGNL